MNEAMLSIICLLLGLLFAFVGQQNAHRERPLG